MNNAGIGIIRISGEDAFKIASDIFVLKSNKKLMEFESHKVYYGYINDNNRIIDEVLLIALKGPKTYTREDTIEIDCHGGNLVMRNILKTVLNYGARLAEPGEFTKRAFLNGRIDLSEAEAVIDVINSASDYALDNSLKQLTGGLKEKIKLIREKIIYEIAYIESALDDPEHYDLTGYCEKLERIIESIYKELSDLKKSFNEGKILSEGINTVILGKPNVGKSSLLNLLTGEDTAIVTDIAGTTRDALKQDIIINGLLLKITDTAGIRDTEDIIEKIGVDKALEYAKDADLVLMMLDSSVEIDDKDIEIFKYIKNKNSIILLNKSDLPSKVSEDDVRKYTEKCIMSISAKDERGIEEFKNKIKEMFIKGELKYNNEVIITNERHLFLIDLALLSLDEVRKSIDLKMPEDFISIDLKNAYEHLGSIIGEKIGDDIVDEIFLKFCMGK
jgi:tRNA modification GTPase